MFKRWIPALFHGFIYVAFLLTQIELIEILVDGVSGNHRIFSPYLGKLYTLVINCIEWLSLFALLATVIFLWRRNVNKIKRFSQPEMAGWPFRDANIILFGEIVLIAAILMMNGSDQVLQSIDPTHYTPTGNLVVSSFFATAFLNGLDISILSFLERIGWWMHVCVVFGFLLYLPFSKHLHILFAFPNTYFASVASPGVMRNMPEIMGEVRSMMGYEEPSGEASDLAKSEM